MASQNNSGNQFDHLHSVTIVATARVESNRFIAFDGTHATSAGAAKDSQGVTQHGADIGEAVTALTSYSGLVQCGEALAQFAFVKPAADGSGKAIAGTATDNCGRALGATSAADQLVEVQLTTHVHPAA